MFLSLLSGGSGKRLWPLSNELRSKQYIKLINSEYTGTNCSMIQRVWEQIEKSGLSDNALITASTGQVEIIRSQLGNINIAVEPDRRDTFPAVLLSCAYARDRMNASPDDIIVILPVDPYTESEFFTTVKSLESVLDQSNADIALLGVIPTEPSTKYGYILIEDGTDNGYYKVNGFKEKPSEETAKKMIIQGALWNCGVFCFRLRYIFDIAERYTKNISYDSLFENYNLLPKISFDYEVLEHTSNIVVKEFSGIWEDLGTWNSLSQKMTVDELGKVISDDNTNTTIINELNIPVVSIGTKDLIIVSTFDGILVADKKSSHKVKDLLKQESIPCMYEERRWGTIKTIDFDETCEGFTLFRKILLFADMSSSYHYHNERDETITVLSGRGEMVIEGVTLTLCQSSTITVPRGKRHAIRAFCDLEYMEIHIGKSSGDEDINRITFDWNEIKQMEEKK